MVARIAETDARPEQTVASMYKLGYAEGVAEGSGGEGAGTVGIGESIVGTFLIDRRFSLVH